MSETAGEEFRHTTNMLNDRRQTLQALLSTLTLGWSEGRRLARDGGADTQHNNLPQLHGSGGRAAEGLPAINFVDAGGRVNDKAAQICDAAIKESTRADVLADAWVTKGNLLLAQKQWDGALLAFLRVPVFYRDEKLFMPAAMLGSARAYRRLDDFDRAKRSLHDLIAAFPKSAEAAVAQTEVQKLQK